MRMMMDYSIRNGSGVVIPSIAPAPFLAGVEMLLDRPPPGSGVVGALLQFGFPAALPAVISGSQVEIWTQNSPVSLLLFPAPSRSLRIPLSTLPSNSSGPVHFSIQVVCLLASNLTCDVNLAATPALSFDY